MPLPWIAAGAGVLVVLGLVLGLQVARIAALRRRIEGLERTLQTLRGDLDAVGSGSLAALERLDRAEPTVEQLAERVGTVELSLPARPYEQAIAAVRRGAGRDELTGRLGLTSTEADLILAIHRPGRGQTTP